MKTKSIGDLLDILNRKAGSWFAGFENVKGDFLYDIASVHEVEHPYRVCDKALFLHVLPRKALVLGVWKEGKDFDDHMLEALGGRIVTITEPLSCEGSFLWPLGQEPVPEGQEEDS